MVVNWEKWTWIHPKTAGLLGIGARLNCPLVSFWERRLSEAKTERENREKALSVTFGDSSPRGRAKGCTLFYFSLPSGRTPDSLSLSSAVR